MLVLNICLIAAPSQRGRLEREDHFNLDSAVGLGSDS